MMQDLSGLPILGQQKPRAMAGAPITLIRYLDEQGTFEPDAVAQTPEGLVAIPGRHNVVTGEDLCDMVVESLKDMLLSELRRIVREEIKAALAQ